MIIPSSSSRPFRKSWLEQMSKMTWGSRRDSESRLQHWILYSVLFQCEEYIADDNAFCCTGKMIKEVNVSILSPTNRNSTLRISSPLLDAWLLPGCNRCCCSWNLPYSRLYFHTGNEKTQQLPIDGGSEHLNQLVRISDMTRQGGSDLFLEDSQLGSVTTPQPTSPMCSQMTSE
jgi:hypothetical protein